MKVTVELGPREARALDAFASGLGMKRADVLRGAIEHYFGTRPADEQVSGKPKRRARRVRVTR